MKNLKDNITIEISMPDGRTTGPIQAKEFNERIKEGLKKMDAKSDKYADKPDYWRDAVLEKIAEELRLKDHEHLREATISFLLSKKGKNNHTQVSFGKAKLPTGLLRYYAKVDFIIVLNAFLWDKADLHKRRAMVDHELCHCTVDYEEDGSRIWILEKHHDLEEFTRIIDRHGLWNDGIKEFGQAVGRQLELGLERSEKKSEAKAAPLQ